MSVESIGKLYMIITVSHGWRDNWIVNLKVAAEPFYFTRGTIGQCPPSLSNDRVVELCRRL